jgi:hypothetical protein
MLQYVLGKINDIAGSYDELTMIFYASGDLHTLHSVVKNQKYIAQLFISIKD